MIACFAPVLKRQANAVQFDVQVTPHLPILCGG
jgi:hypothetical protein